MNVVRWLATPFAWLAGYVIGNLWWTAQIWLCGFLQFLPPVKLILLTFAFVGSGGATFLGSAVAVGMVASCAPSHKRAAAWTAYAFALIAQILFAFALELVKKDYPNDSSFWIQYSFGWLGLIGLAIHTNRQPEYRIFPQPIADDASFSSTA